MDYLAERTRLAHYYNETLDIAADDYLQGQCELVSAGLRNYLPLLPTTTHAQLYREMLFYKQVSVWEQTDVRALEYVQTEGEGLATLQEPQKGPFIFCTMHTGSYRLLNLYLIQQGIPFTLVIGHAVLQREGKAFEQVYAYLNKPGSLPLIDAEQSSAGIQMLRALKEGRSLVLYLDGHTGAGADTVANSNSCIVDFLGQQLYARKGIAHLAHAAKVPILPVACYCSNISRIHLHFYAAILPDAQQERALFALQTTQALYKLFGRLIERYPGQWEGWLTLHQTALVSEPEPFVPPIKKTGKIFFNSRDYGIFKWEAVPYLLAKLQYQFYAIDEALYDLLISCKAEPIDPAPSSAAILSDLTKQGIVVFV